MDIGHDIAGIFEADRRPDSAVIDAQVQPFLEGNSLMCRSRRMGDQAFGIPQIVGDIDQAESIEETKCPFPTALEIESYDGPSGVHL